MSYIAYDDLGLASSVVELGWVQDGITDVEAEAIDWFSNFSDAEVALSVVDLDWVQEGIGKQEARALEELSFLSRKNEGHASRIVDMPFLKTLESPDIAAMESLVDMAWFRQADYQRVLSHPTLSNGITDDWAKIVATLYGVSDTNPDLIDTLLDPDQVTLEDRTIDLPLTGETHLAIIRTGPGAERSMDLLGARRPPGRGVYDNVFPHRLCRLAIRRRGHPNLCRDQLRHPHRQPRQIRC